MGNPQNIFLNALFWATAVMPPLPPLWHPSGAIIPEKVILPHTIAKRRGGLGGQDGPLRNIGAFQSVVTWGFYKAQELYLLKRGM